MEKLNASFKLSFHNVKYETDNKSFVRCKGIVTLSVNGVDWTTLVFNSNKIYEIAILKEGDKFDYNLGSKIALAKLERRAYKIAYKGIKKYVEDAKEVVDISLPFLEKCCSVIDHNTEYIKKLSNLEIIKENTNI